MTASRNPPRSDGWDGNQDAETATTSVASTAANAPGLQRLQRAVTEGDVLPQAALAAGIATLVAVTGLQFPTPADWMATWRGVSDLAASLWLLGFFLALPAIWILDAALARRRGTRRDAVPADAPHVHVRSRTAPGALRRLWPALLLGVCALELALHHSERNPFVATSRPEAGVETWTTADGYAMLLDGHIAQGDGAFLLPLLELFLGDKPPSGSEFDRRAGHVYLVSLLITPLGTYWAFAALNLLSWWAASLAVWWLGARRWPGTATPWIASLLTATGHGFIFMAAAPQAHAVAFGAFALLLALFDRAGALDGGRSLATWARLGWSIGAAGLVYLVHLPALLALWLAGAARGRVAGLALASATALAIVFGWEAVGRALLGLSFTGGNNDLAGEALRGWMTLADRGTSHLVGQLRASSLRGLFGGAYWYPWWALAFAGWWVSGGANRRWTLAVLVAGALPAIAFTTRFNLPRVAYFTFPAVYLLCGAGLSALQRAAPSRGLGALAAGLGVTLLIALSNADVVGFRQLYLWFHYSQGNQW